MKFQIIPPTNPMKEDVIEKTMVEQNVIDPRDLKWIIIHSIIPKKNMGMYRAKINKDNNYE